MEKKLGEIEIHYSLHKILAATENLGSMRFSNCMPLSQWMLAVS